MARKTDLFYVATCTVGKPDGSGLVWLSGDRISASDLGDEADRLVSVGAIVHEDGASSKSLEKAITEKDKQITELQARVSQLEALLDGATAPEPGPEK